MLRRVLTALLIASAPVASQAGPALVIDSRSGLVLYSEDADDLWHPASLTKLMTAYIAFEALRDGKITVQSDLTVSQNAFKEPPSKIGLPVGAKMSLDLALKALIIKSANDVAVMIAEGVAGSEQAFVDRMNQTAARLGMTRTKFFNPNGLPHDGQVTTARDMAILGQRILKEFPEWSELFKMDSFKVGNRTLRTHNALLKTFEGADGMKTGFICDSGFNVVASATRNDVSVMAVVLGERSSRERTARASELIEHGFDFYGWKEMFSASLDQVAVEKVPDDRPGDMSKLVCRR
jgi:D-alanyl-D-alanine carboxypeptidase